MKVLVCLHSADIGGSQLNAMELGTRARDAGHEVELFGPDGVLVSRIAELGLPYHRAPVQGSWPSIRNMRRLVELVRDRGFDVVHCYEREPAADVALGPHLWLGTPMVITVMSMNVSRLLPRHVPLLVSTHGLAGVARTRHRDVGLMEPPIDTDLNAPSPDPALARRQLGVSDGERLLSVVCRLSNDLNKAPGVLEAVTVVGELADRHPVRLLVVGDGPELSRVREAAAAVNLRTGRETVIVTGQLLDPRPAYDAADVVLGMGSSAQKGLSFAKPLVVQGTNGFWKVLTPDTVEGFLEGGWWGHGTGEGVAALRDVLERLLTDEAEWPVLGAFGRDLIVRRCSLGQAAQQLEELYHRAILDRRPVVDRVLRLALLAVRIIAYKLARAVRTRVLPDRYWRALRSRGEAWQPARGSRRARRRNREEAGHRGAATAGSSPLESSGDRRAVGNSERIGHTTGR